MKTALTKKLGPLPRWAWLGILLVLVIVWWYRRRQNAANQVATAGAIPSGQSTNVVPVQSGAGVQDMAGAMSGQPAANAAPSDQLSGEVLQTIGAENSALVQALSQALAGAYSGGAGAYATSTGQLAGWNPGGPMQPASTVTAPVATTPSTPSATATKVATPAQPFGGIVSKTKLKNGATLTTYASGRQVEQLPGHSPYVVHA